MGAASMFSTPMSLRFAGKIVGNTLRDIEIQICSRFRLKCTDCSISDVITATMKKYIQLGCRSLSLGFLGSLKSMIKDLHSARVDLSTTIAREVGA